MTHPRADNVLVDLGLFASREKAKAAIIAGRVSAGGSVVAKPGQPLDPAADISVTDEPEYVSRGGHKLAGALDAFGLDVAGARAIDVGASTGGFTDCLLQRGAASVASVDVGYGQLAWSLRRDPRVTVFERTNIRYAKPGDFGAPFDIAVVDVSFIGLDKVLPTVFTLLDQEGQTFALVKPQFEAGRARVGKGGVVRDSRTHTDVLAAVMGLAERLGMVVRGATWSPVPGPKGNIEFWVWLSRDGERTQATAEQVVLDAHEALGG